MITLYINGEDAFVWNADDWLSLRENYRIVGNLVGCVASLPRQDIIRGLPCMLLPEEVTLLLEKKIVKLMSYTNVTENIITKAKETFTEYRKKVRQEQISYYEDERRKQVVSMIDRIIEGKKRKLSSTKNKQEQENTSAEETLEIDREAILKSELEKAGNIPESNTLVQTFTADVWHSEALADNINWTFPTSKEEKLKYFTFKDLWERGYHITSGQKFGGDFLVYPGDPIKFHAQFIVVCVDMESELTASDIVTYGRLGSSTRKTLIIASVSKDSTVIYQSLTWADVN